MHPKVSHISMNVLKPAQSLIGVLAFIWIARPSGESQYWDLAETIAISIIAILIATKLIEASRRMQVKLLVKKIYETFCAESLLLTVVCTTVLSSIIYFANSRDFYAVQSEDQVRDPNHVIIQPSEHLVHSGEDYPIRVMVKNPFSWRRDAQKPLIVCLLYFSIAPYIKNEKSNQGMNITRGDAD